MVFRIIEDDDSIRIDREEGALYILNNIFITALCFFAVKTPLIWRASLGDLGDDSLARPTVELLIIDDTKLLSTGMT
jgi:hypothetical protein